MTRILSCAGRGFVVPPATSGWSSTDKDPTIVVSNSNRTATLSSGLTGGRGVVGKSSGKHYWEVRCEGDYTIIGVATSAWDFGYSTGGDVWWGYYGMGSLLPTFGPLGAAYGNGDLVGLAMDVTARTVAFYLNDVLQDTISISAGTWYAAYCLQPGYPGDAVVTGNFKPADLVYSPPSGYVADM